MFFLKSGVTDDTIKALKRSELCVEVNFRTTKKISIGALDRVVSVDRILIPLSGEYAKSGSGENLVTIFWGNRKYDLAPLRAPSVFYDRLRRLSQNAML